MQNPFAENIIPIGFVVKFKPAVLGLVYKRHDKERKKHLYQIHLNNLVYLTQPDHITRQLYFEHPNFLNEMTVKFE